MPENHNSNQNQALTQTPEDVLAQCSALLSQKNPDLSMVIENWPKLPEHVKKTIETLIEAYTPTSGNHNKM